MTNSIELQVICRILMSDDDFEVDRLCSYDASYYSILTEQIQFILDHKDKTGKVPDLFTFQAQFEDLTLIQVGEPLSYLEEEIKKNKQRILFLETYNKIADLGSGDITEAWEYLSRQCECAADLNNFQPVNIVKDAEIRAEKILEYNKQTRIPTGFKEIDEIMYGGLSTVEEFLVIVARTNAGKAQPLWSKVLTPHGWTTMGELKLGDTVIGENNDNGKVVKIYPQGCKDYYRVNFDDGTCVECCDDHLWKVLDKSRRDNSNSQYGEHLVLRLEEIRKNLNREYSVDITKPIQFASKAGKGKLTDFDVNESSISEDWLTAPIFDRKVLFDSMSNSVNYDSESSCYIWNFTTSCEKQSQYFSDLARSLGLKTSVIYQNSIFCVTCQSKPVNASKNRHCKFIKSVEYAGKTECQCILLDNKTHTYITDGYTVTHNSWVSTKMMESAQSHGFPVLYYSPEMQSSFIGTRFDTWRSHFKNSDLYLGRYSDEYKKYIKDLVKEETGAYVVEDSDMSEGRTTVHGLETLVKRYKIKLLIIDGLSYITTNARYGNESLKYKDICNDLFRLSKTYGCAVVAAVQANRETRENRDENGEIFPSIFNISESDHPARIATQVFSMRQLYERHVMEIRLEKSRNARNERPTLAYSIDLNTGSMEFIADGADSISSNSDEFRTPIVTTQITTHLESEPDVEEDEDYSDVEF